MAPCTRARTRTCASTHEPHPHARKHEPAIHFSIPRLWTPSYPTLRLTVYVLIFPDLIHICTDSDADVGDSVFQPQGIFGIQTQLRSRCSRRILWFSFCALAYKDSGHRLFFFHRLTHPAAFLQASPQKGSAIVRSRGQVGIHKLFSRTHHSYSSQTLLPCSTA